MSTKEFKEKIREKAMCLFVHNGKTLVSKGYDKAKGENFYRLLGGSLNFFESAEKGVRREIKEELHSEIENLELLRVVENLFVYEGNRGHEIVFVFSGNLSRKNLYNQKTIHILEETYEFDAEWIPIEEILGKKIPLYPTLDYDSFLN